MNNLQNILRSSDAIAAAFDVGISMGPKVYLVGGAVRDLLIDSKLGSDFDFAVEGKGIPFARSFAERVGGSFFILDEERDTARVVSKSFQADFSGVRGNIDEDLRTRDFTLNSMAIPLDERLVVSGQLSDVSLIDPMGGRRDIGDGVLRATSQNSLKDDPLRILRAFRFCSAFSLRMDAELMEHIIMDCGMLSLVSPERIRAELFMILDMPGAGNALLVMNDAGVLRALFAEVEKWKGFYQGGWHAHDLFEHSMKTVEMAEEVLEDTGLYLPGHSSEIEQLMSQELEDHVTRRGLLKLASLLHDSGKFYTRIMEGDRGRFFGHEKKSEEICKEIAKGLKLSRRSERMLRVLAANHMRILGLSKLKKVTDRAMLRFFRDTHGFGLDLLLLSLADARATPVEGARFEELSGLVQGLADYYFEEFMDVPPKPLLTGEDVMRIFGIPEGRKVGDMLELLREAETMGKVSDKREAVDYLKKMLLSEAPLGPY